MEELVQVVIVDTFCSEKEEEREIEKIVEENSVQNKKREKIGEFQSFFEEKETSQQVGEEFDELSAFQKLKKLELLLENETHSKQQIKSNLEKQFSQKLKQLEDENKRLKEKLESEKKSQKAKINFLKTELKEILY